MESSVPPIVDAAWVRDHPEVVLADVRWYLDGRDGHAAYLDGHLPGAVWVDVDTVLAAPATPHGGRHPIPTPEDFAAGLGALGIADDAVVVAHDDAAGSTAARLVWLLRVLGRPAALLDGGIDAWTTTGGELETGPVDRTPVVRTPLPWPAGRFATADEVAAAALSDDAVVLDARAAERYTGTANAAVDARHGHVPGAVSAPWGSNVGTDGRFLSVGELREAYRSRGVEADSPVIAYCGSGVTACHDLLALERIGVVDAALFPGSWSAWGADEARPVAAGATPLGDA
jgi:thiosulfate/3-mercaptopyruvate sulfurtransferase